MRTTQEVLACVRASYLEMPGLELTVPQVAHLCGIEPMLSRTLLDTLVGEQFLGVTSDGAYARPTERAVPRPRPAKAGLRATPRS
ncbi:MAG: hypothetical protein PVSMB1_05680 [Gemmatimonadaceae bacterium]